jgi:shikimate kinase
MQIFLIGFMGSGKTTIGLKLACDLGYNFIDQDELIEQRYKMSVSDIFKNYGEAKFREAEHEVFVDLTGKNDIVVATGGGAPCFSDNMELINNAITIYLKAESKTLLHRVKDSTDTRPLLAGKTDVELLQFITNKLAEREPFYNQAKIIMKTDGMSVKELIFKIKERL